MIRWSQNTCLLWLEMSVVKKGGGAGWLGEWARGLVEYVHILRLQLSDELSVPSSALAMHMLACFTRLAWTQLRRDASLPGFTKMSVPRRLPRRPQTTRHTQTYLDIGTNFSSHCLSVPAIVVFSTRLNPFGPQSRVSPGLIEQDFRHSR